MLAAGVALGATTTAGAGAGPSASAIAMRIELAIESCTILERATMVLRSSAAGPHLLKKKIELMRTARRIDLEAILLC